MATCVLGTPQKGNMQNWTNVFPKTDFTTIEGSTMFIKKLIAVSLSSITYMRGIFPECAYGERKLGGLKLKILDENCGLKAVSGFIDLIRGCYDAVEKKYLHHLSVGVCLNPENRNEVIEAYKLEFRYTNDECSITCHNTTKVFSPKQNDPTVKASFLMLKNIYTVSDLLGPLPKCPYITLKLLYYDEVTPPDYEPPGFEPSCDVKFNFPEKCLNIDLGKVDTKQHGLKFLLKSALRKPPLSQAEDPLLAASQSLISGGNINSTANNVQNNSQSVISSCKGSGSSQIPSFKCLCESKTANNANTIICGSCEIRQHKTCYGIINEKDIPDVFYCVDCIIHNTDGKEFTDMVYKYRGKELKEFCAMRRALMLCAMQEKITRQDLEKCLGCTRAFSNNLIERLEFEGYITSTEDRGVYLVDDAHLQEFWQQYFPNNVNGENEDPDYTNNLQNESPSNEIIETNDDAMHEDDGQTFIPESDNKENDSWDQNVNNSKSKGYPLSPTFENKADSSEHDTPTMDDIINVDSSIKKVKRLSISTVSNEGTTTRKSRKRKASTKGVTVNDSDELFQSQKKPRRKRRAQ